MAEEIPGTQLQSQLIEDNGSDSNSSDNEPKRRMSRLKSNRREDDVDGFSDDFKEDNSDKSDDNDDDENKSSNNNSDNDSSASEEEDDDGDLFGDKEIEEEEEEEDREKPTKAQKRKRSSKTDNDNVTATTTNTTAAAAAAPRDFLSEIEDAKKIELVQQHLPPTNRKGYLIHFPTSVGVQRHMYDRQKYEKRDPQKFLTHTIRWRRAPGNRAVRESNTRLVRWSNNSYTLHIGATVIPLGALKLQGYHYMAIRSNGRMEPHTSMSQRLNVFIPQDVLASTATKSRTTIAKLVDDSLLDYNSGKLGTATEESRSRENFKKRPGLDREFGEEYDNDINDDQSEKNSANSIRNAKKPKKRQKK